MDAIISRLLKNQNMMSGVALAVIILLLSKTAGVDVPGMTDGLGQALTALGLLAAGVKGFLPPDPKAAAPVELPPGTKIETAAVLTTPDAPKP